MATYDVSKIESMINTLYNSFADIKAALEEKGVIVTNKVTTFAQAIRNIKGGPNSTEHLIGIVRELDSKGVLGFPSDQFEYSLECAEIIAYGLYNSFRGCTSIVGLKLDKLKSLSGVSSMDNSFYSCTNLEEISFPELETISGTKGMSGSFYSCSKLTEVAFPKLTTVSGAQALYQTFYGCRNLGIASFDSLSVVTGNSAMDSMFKGCTNLKQVSFDSLNSKSFGTSKNQLKNFLGSVKDVTVHFPSNMESIIKGLDTASTNFGATKATILYDLPATS